MICSCTNSLVKKWSIWKVVRVALKCFLFGAILWGHLPAAAQSGSTIMLSENCDTAAVDGYLQRSKKLMELHNDSVYYYLNLAVQQSYHCNFNERIVTSLTELAAWHFSHNPDEAIRYAHLALREYENRKILPAKNKTSFTKLIMLLPSRTKPRASSILLPTIIIY